MSPEHIVPDFFAKQIEKRSRAKAVSSRKVRRLCKLIQNGEAIPAGLLPDAPTMAAWILYCKRNGLFAEGVILYEQGSIDTDMLSDDCAVRLEEDYRSCKRRVGGEGISQLSISSQPVGYTHVPTGDMHEYEAQRDLRRQSGDYSMLLTKGESTHANE